MTYSDQKRFCKGWAVPTPYEQRHYFQATPLAGISVGANSLQRATDLPHFPFPFNSPIF